MYFSVICYACWSRCELQFAKHFTSIMSKMIFCRKTIFKSNWFYPTRMDLKVKNDQIYSRRRQTWKWVWCKYAFWLLPLFSIHYSHVTHSLKNAVLYWLNAGLKYGQTTVGLKNVILIKKKKKRAVKWLFAVNRIQNKRLYLDNVGVLVMCKDCEYINKTYIKYKRNYIYI